MYMHRAPPSRYPRGLLNGATGRPIILRERPGQVRFSETENARVLRALYEETVTDDMSEDEDTESLGSEEGVYIRPTDPVAFVEDVRAAEPGSRERRGEVLWGAELTEDVLRAMIEAAAQGLERAAQEAPWGHIHDTRATRSVLEGIGFAITAAALARSREDGIREDDVGPPVEFASRTLREAADCAVCLEPIAAEGDVPSIPCMHAFHAQCLAEWQARAKRSCPLCRRHFTAVS